MRIYNHKLQSNSSSNNKPNKRIFLILNIGICIGCVISIALLVIYFFRIKDIFQKLAITKTETVSSWRDFFPSFLSPKTIERNTFLGKECKSFSLFKIGGFIASLAITCIMRLPSLFKKDHSVLSTVGIFLTFFSFMLSLDTNLTFYINYNLTMLTGDIALSDSIYDKLYEASQCIDWAKFWMFFVCVLHPCSKVLRAI